MNNVWSESSPLKPGDTYTIAGVYQSVSLWKRLWMFIRKRKPSLHIFKVLG
jgi:hypothetical protein